MPPRRSPPIPPPRLHRPVGEAVVQLLPSMRHPDAEARAVRMAGAAARRGVTCNPDVCFRPIPAISDAVAAIDHRCIPAEVTTFDHVKLPSSPPGWFDYRYYVLSDGALAILRADRDINAEYRAWWEKAQTATFGQNMPDLWTGSARLSTVTGTSESNPISVPLVRYPELDRFPDGRWLLASSRAKLGEQNGIIAEADGGVSKTLRLGDAIQHLRCAPDGSIWIGYFDEGIFGRDFGAGGIAHFNGEGELLWSFNEGKQVGEPLVFDCYALTLKGNELWSCFYNDFPIVQIVDGRETVWANTAVAGAKALAVDGSFAVLAGGYGADANRLALLKLTNGEARLLGSYNLPELENAALMSGGSSVIHVVANGIWARISVEDVRQRLAS